MLSFSETRDIASKEIQKMSSAGIQLVLIEDASLDYDEYSVFFYQSKKYFESGNFSDLLAGNAPLIIDKYKGEIHTTGTANDIEYYLRSFERLALPKLR
jgi:hypothetical protein